MSVFFFSFFSSVVQMEELRTNPPDGGVFKIRKLEDRELKPEVRAPISCDVKQETHPTTEKHSKDLFCCLTLYICVSVCESADL